MITSTRRTVLDYSTEQHAQKPGPLWNFQYKAEATGYSQTNKKPAS